MHGLCPNDSLASLATVGATLPAMRRALLIVGKPPEPGLTKTRLVPPLTPDDAARLYHGFLLDSVQLGLALGWERISIVHPRGGRQALAELLPPAVCLIEQRGQGLRDALSSAFADHLAEGFVRVVLIGSDNPTLPVCTIEEACDALDNHDMCIGPSADGGYYLIGMRAPQPGLFEGIDWSTSRVFAQTQANAQRLRLRVHSLQEWYDVDEPADLERLERELVALPETVAPYTRAALVQLGAPARLR
jgi:rSAM/selenodomain-associated transferase 1